MNKLRYTSSQFPSSIDAFWLDADKKKGHPKYLCFSQIKLLLFMYIFFNVTSGYNYTVIRYLINREQSR